MSTASPSSLFLPEDAGSIFCSPDVARINLISGDELERDQPALTEAVEKVVLDRQVLTDHPPFFWRMAISTHQVDSYGTQMMPSSLRNYAQDATDGRAFLIGHDKRVAPTGYSLAGRYFAGQGGGQQRTEADFYTLTGMPDTDPVVAKLRGALIRDASISFNPGQVICSIDGADMMLASWEECMHFPGMLYKKDGSHKRGAKSRDELVMCVGKVEDGHMRETSGVYDGATPGAGVVKALRAANAGLLSINQRDVLEQHYRMRLPGQGRVFGGVDVPDREGEGTIVGDKAQQQAAATDGAPVVVPSTDLVAGTGQQPTPILRLNGLDEAVRALGLDPGADPVAALRAFEPQLSELRTMADAGRAYRTRLVGDGLALGVRAMGDSFDKATWEATLNGVRQVGDLEKMVDNLRAAAEKIVPSGRATTDVTPEPGVSDQRTGARRRQTPNSAFQA